MGGDTMTEIDKPIEPRGIGGWLILISISVVGIPLVFGFNAISLANDALRNIDALTRAFLPMIVVVAELIINISITLFSLYVAYLFFSHKKRFPDLCILLLVVAVAAQLFDMAMSNLLFGLEVDKHDVGGLIRSAILAGIWSSYMHRSKRVANTFVND